MKLEPVSRRHLTRVATGGAIGIIAASRRSTPPFRTPRITMATQPTAKPAAPPPPEVIQVDTASVGCDAAVARSATVDLHPARR